MIKTQTSAGHPAFRIKLEMIFTISDFCRALAEESYQGEEGEPSIDFQKLTKSAAKNILFNRLKWNGRQGEFQGLEDLGDGQELLNEEYDKAKTWVEKNYPYLKTD